MICLYKTAGSVLVVRGIGAVANGNTARATLRNVTPCQAFHATCRRGPYGGNIGGIRSLKNAIRTTLLRPSAMWLTSDKPLRCKGLQRIAKYGNMISRGVGNIWQSFQIGGYECIKREYIAPIKRGAIAAGPGLEKERGRRRYSVMGSAETSPVCFCLPVIDS